MSRKCEICGKGPMTGNNRSHANNSSRRVFRPNVQKIRVFEDGTIKRKTVCTSCIRSGKVTKAPLTIKAED